MLIISVGTHPLQQPHVTKIQNLLVPSNFKIEKYRTMFNNKLSAYQTGVSY